MLRTMRVAGWLSAISLVMVGVSGCAALDSAAEKTDKAQVCAKALAAAGYTPDWSDPEKSATEAKDRSDQLRDLANSTADANLQRELREMSDEMNLDVRNMTPASTADWTKRKAAQLSDLRSACT